ncbi:hypothetical protein PUR61_02075 [Streptomyces sp. BE20]|uniref:hypothetical protein n=1 Tax=Streptomyces sp. BE20 TaxID=3002525 RepID=UPI002E7642AD|nr:hypothetical protein [Streptomyces sp. BE20]MEE1820994.1 hypothetical protein [Streptomyces sp. BE20]
MRHLAGPLSVEEIAARHGCDVTAVTAAEARLCEAAGAGSRTQLIAVHALAGDLALEDLGAPDPHALEDLGGQDLLLLRLSAALNPDDIARELGLNPSAVAVHQQELLEETGLDGVHQLIALACLAGAVRRADVHPGREHPATAPALPAVLAPLVEPAQRALVRTGRALLVAPRAWQAELARAVTLHEGGTGARLLAVAPHGEHWADDVTVLAQARRDAGHVAVLLAPGEATKRSTPPTPPQVPVATSPRDLRRLVGQSLPATVITSPDGLAMLGRTDDRTGPYDLAIAFDAHLPEIGERVGRHRWCPPARAALRLTSTPRLTAADRTRHEGCDLYTAGPITASLSPRQAADAGRTRRWRLAAAAAPSPQLAGLGGLVLTLADTHRLVRVLVDASTGQDAAHVADAITTAARVRGDDGVLAEVLPHDHGIPRDEALQRFRHSPQRLRILVVSGPVPVGLDADALVHTTGDRSAARTAAAVEAALTASGTAGQRPLLLVGADSSEDGRRPALSTLAGALAALDPDLKKDLRAARSRGDGWPGLEPALPGGVDEQRARTVCAWADTTLAEEMRTTADHANATADPDVLSPTCLRLSTRLQGQKTVKRRATVPVQAPGPPTGPAMRGRTPPGPRR